MLQWQPIASIPLENKQIKGFLAAAPLPKLSDSPDLRKGLQALSKVCTGQIKGAEHESLGTCGLQLGTTLTLLHLLRGLSERVEGVLPPQAPDNGAPSDVGEASYWQLVAQHTAHVCQLPADYLTQWEALMCWCFGGTESPSLVTWKLQPTPDFHSHLTNFMGHGHVPILEVELLIQNDPALLATLMSGGATRSDIQAMVKQERLDLIGFDPGSLEIRCLIPPGFESANTASVMPMDTSQMPARVPVSASPFMLQDTKLTKFRCPPPARLMGENWSKACDAAVHAAVVFSKSRNLEVVKATESASGYHYSFAVQKDSKPRKPTGKKASGSKATKATTVTPLSSDTKAPSTRVLELSLSQPPSSAALLFPWPVEKTGDIAQFRSPSLDVIMRKPWVWPHDDEILDTFTVENLPAATIQEITNHMSHMFTVEEGIAKLAPGSLSPSATAFRLKSTLFNLKESVQVFLLFSKQRGKNGCMMHHLIDPTNPPYSGASPEEATLTLVVHNVLKLPDGRPLAHISYVDHKIEMQVNRTRAELQQALGRFDSIANLSYAHEVGTNKVTCKPGELLLLKRILEQNAQRLKAPKWQEKMIKGSQWQATFLLPLYTGESCSFY